MAFWTQIIISTGSGSITISSATSGSIDGTNTAFGFASKPKIIVSDDASYRENFGWTWNSGTLTATMNQAPSFDIYSIS